MSYDRTTDPLVRHTMDVVVTAVIQSPNGVDPEVTVKLMSELVGKGSSVGEIMLSVGHELQRHLDALHDNQTMHYAPHPETRSITIQIFPEEVMDCCFNRLNGDKNHSSDCRNA